MFANLSLYQREQSGNLLPDWKRLIKRMFLLSCSGILPWLMKAYSNNGHLSCEQKQFNYRLSKARVVVEHGYGRLKEDGDACLDMYVSDVPEVVTACVFFMTSVKFMGKNLVSG